MRVIERVDHQTQRVTSIFLESDSFEEERILSHILAAIQSQKEITLKYHITPIAIKEIAFQFNPEPR